MLPATVCTGPSWEQTRSLIERDFTLDVVIASHDPLRWNFSDSTDLSEALLIATRRSEKSDARNTALPSSTFGRTRTVCSMLIGWRRPSLKRSQGD